MAALTLQPHAQGNAVIFADDFDQPADLSRRYFEYGDEKGHFVWSQNEGYGGRSGAMKCQFEKGMVSAGSLKVLFGKNPFNRGVRPQETFREIYWRVYVQHEAGWEGNPAKLARATCMAGSDWSQGFIAHVWGGKDDVLCIDPASGIRDSRKVSTKYNDFDHLRWLGLRQGQTPIFHLSESGRWVCIESHIRLNTPGKQDGIFELWIDGQLEAARNDLDWHGEWTDYGINAVFLENYWNDGSVKRQARWFDNFVISTQPIGPITAPLAPAFTRSSGTGITAWEAQAAADPEGKHIVWTSKTTNNTEKTLTVDAAHGAFSGDHTSKRQLAANATYWLRLRERSAAGQWSAWTAWHAPFHTRSASAFSSSAFPVRRTAGRRPSCRGFYTHGTQERRHYDQLCFHRPRHRIEHVAGTPARSAGWAVPRGSGPPGRRSTARDSGRLRRRF